MIRRYVKPLLPLLAIVVAGFLAFLASSPAPAAVVPKGPITEPGADGPKPGAGMPGTTPSPTNSKTKGPTDTTVPVDPSSSISDAPAESSAPKAGPSKPCSDCVPEAAGGE